MTISSHHILPCNSPALAETLFLNQLDHCQKPYSFISTVILYFLLSMILSNVDTLQSTPKLDKSEIVLNIY